MTTRLWSLARTDRATGREAMRVFSYSITLLTVLFVAMAATSDHQFTCPLSTAVPTSPIAPPASAVLA